MLRIHPVANGTRTDHPSPGLPFVNDGRLPLDKPDAIERTGRNQGKGLWGRTDPLNDGGWVAFTTEPKNPQFAWAVHRHPLHGRTVLLIHDRDLSVLHHAWVHEPKGILYRHGGYWWDGDRWNRPALVTDAAYEAYDVRPVERQVTLTAADVLRAPCNAQNAGIATIAGFTAPEGPIANWQDHLALWAQLRASDSSSRPVESCVVDFHAPELETDSLVGMAGLTKITAVAAEDMPDLRYGGAENLPEPQEGTGEAMRWSVPVARDWAENHHQKNGPRALLSATTSYGTTQPVGLVNGHNRLRGNFLEDLTKPNGPRRRPHMKGEDARQAADDLAWTAATTLMYGSDYGLVPHSALRHVLVDAVLGHLAEHADGKRESEDLMWLPTRTVTMLVWFFQHRPDSTAGILGEVCLQARLRFGTDPARVGRMLRASFLHHSSLGSNLVNRLLDMALPPSARRH